MDVYDGEDTSLRFDFLVDGDFVVPASATYTVRDHLGSPISGLVNVAISLTGSSTSAPVVVVGSHNTLTGGDTFENRTVEVAFVSNSDTYRIRRSYRVIPWINYTASADAVRATLGVTSDEIGDDQIDFFVCYLRVLERVGATPMAAALAATDLKNEDVNKAITYLAALYAIPTLRLGIAQSEMDDSVSAARYDDVDLDALTADITDKYEEAILGFTLDQVQNFPTILGVSTPVDPVTNT